MARISLACCLLAVAAAAQSGYREPASHIVDLVDAPPSPAVRPSPDGSYLVLAYREAMPSIATMARPILRLAGRRFDPATHGPQRGARRTGLSIVSVASRLERRLTLPDGADVSGPMFAADGSKFAFTNTTDDGIELWVADAKTAKARKLEGFTLNAVFGSAVQWTTDQQGFLCLLWPGGAAPERPRVPAGPSIQEATGEAAPVRTYQDLLTDDFDRELFAHHATAQIAFVDAHSGTVTPVGEPGLIRAVSQSPDGQYLLVTKLLRPFSLIVPERSFGRTIEVWNREGQLVKQIAKLGIADKVPIGGVPRGARDVQWIPTQSATLMWVSALDRGDPNAAVPHRDLVVVQAAPFDKFAKQWCRTEYRYRSAMFGEQGELALLATYDRDRRWTRLWQLSLTDLGAEPKLLHERAAADAYGDPGTPLTELNAAGREVVVRRGDALFLTGDGASPDGDRPFLDRLDLSTGAKERLFHCAKGVYATVADILDDDGTQLLIRRESPTEPPNYFVRYVHGAERQVTGFKDPFAPLKRSIQKRLLVYERADGVPLSGTIYLPPNASTRLPMIIWAYPREYTSAKTAGQVRGSPYRYTRLSGSSALLFLMAGYAVFDGAAMPIIGPKETANDTFVEQLVAGAKAAVDVAVKENIADPKRIAIAGHSYGAFMTANLLAHSDLFRAGIARSGAFNRTLTPFGFQNERRTYWEAPELYHAMSPFMHAPKIDEPLLLIHGEVDNNSGTFPIQSRRLYHATKGHGGRVRLVMLPHESHGYRARESVLHVLAESIDWLDKHVKPDPSGLDDRR